MSRAFQKGILTGIAVYGLGAILTVIVPVIVGWEYRHRPPASALPVLLTLVVGTIRLLITANSALMQNSPIAKGELAIHVFAALLFVLFILWLKHM